MTEKIGMRTKYQKLTTIQKLILWVCMLLIFYTSAGFLLVPYIAKSIIIKKIPELLGRQASITRISLNPYKLTATIEGFAIKRTDGTKDLVSFDRLFINLQLASIVKKALIIKEFSLNSPKINLTRNADLSLNISDLIGKNKGADSTDQNKEKSAFLFSINNILISNANAVFEDLPKEKIHRIESLKLAIPNISNLPFHITNYVQPYFAATINGTPFKLEGKSKPFHQSLDTAIDINIDDFDIHAYLPYFPNPTDAELKSGLLNIKSTLSYTNDETNNASLSISGLISLKNLVLNDQKDNNFLQIPEISFDLANSNLLNKEIKLNKILISKPEIKLAILDEKNTIYPINLLNSNPENAQHTDPEDGKTEESNSLSQAISLEIAEIFLDQGKVNFEDINSKDFKSTLFPINFKINNFSLSPKNISKLDLRIETESQEKLFLAGDIGISPIKFTGQAGIEALKIPKYMPYLKQNLNAVFNDGLIDLNFDIFFSKDEIDQGTRINKLAIDLKDLSFADISGKPIVNLPLFSLSNAEVDLDKKLVGIGKIITKNAKIDLQKNENGQFNFSDLLIKPQAEQATTDKEENQAEHEKTETKPEWIVKLSKANIEKYSLNYKDQSLGAPATILVNDFSLDVADISTAANHKGQISLSLKLNNSGEIQIKGDLGINPPAAALHASLDKIGIKDFQPYIAEHARIIAVGGVISAGGNIDVINNGPAKPAISYHGNFKINDLAAVDEEAREDIFKFKELSFEKIKMNSEPLSLNIDVINLKDIYSKIIIGEDGKINLSSLKRNDLGENDGESIEDDAEIKQEKKSSSPISIANILIDNGHLAFIDKKINPSYSTALTDIKGSIKGVSSNQEEIAELAIDGKLDQHSPLLIKGRLNPLAEKLFADIKINLNNINLSQFSPYTGKFIGYKTDNGKLSLNLNYQIDGKKLDAKNHAFLDQFTLGDSVDSPDAPNLPVGLAIALLQNRKGEIKLDIPLQGNLDDPEFSIGAVVVQVIFNLITKAITSPFALLGALIPDGEDLQHLNFAPGKADIPPETLEQLAKMSEVLFERPGLKVDIIGKVDPIKDRQVMAETQLEKMIKLQKIEAIKKTDKSSTILPEEIIIAAEEYPLYLESLYETSLLPEEMKEEKLTAPEMTQKILEKIEIKDDNLRQLALARSGNVMKFLIQDGKIEPDRLFVIEPKFSKQDIDNTKDTGTIVEMIIK